MGIDIPCHICIRVSHQILQVLDCHSGIGRMPLPAGSCATVLISKIFVLALSCPKNTAFFIFSLCGHCQTPFRCGKSLNWRGYFIISRPHFPPQNIKTNGKCRFQIPFKGSTLYQPFGADPPNIWAIVIAGQIPQLVNADAKTGCRFFKGQISFFPNGNLVFQPAAPAFPKYFSIFVLFANCKCKLRC